MRSRRPVGTLEFWVAGWPSLVRHRPCKDGLTRVQIPPRPHLVQTAWISEVGGRHPVLALEFDLLARAVATDSDKGFEADVWIYELTAERRLARSSAELLPRPSSLRCLLRALDALRLSHLRCSRLATLQASLSPESDGSRVLPLVGDVGLSLACRLVHDLPSEFVRVAGALP